MVGSTRSVVSSASTALWTEQAGPADRHPPLPAASWMETALIALGGAAAALLVYGFAVEPRILASHTEQVELPFLPPECDGCVLAVLADFHVGMRGANIGTVDRAVREILRRRPDAVLLLGDFIYMAEGDLPRQLTRVRDVLRPLSRSGIPGFAVLGNHDYGVSSPGEAARPELVRGVVATLGSLGLQVLHNEAVVLPLRAATCKTLYVGGLGPAWAGEDRTDVLLQQIPPGMPRVVFMHQPESFARLPAGSAPLAIAAHTQGGQIALPFVPRERRTRRISRENAHVAGWIDGYGAPGNRLYVNRGIGFSSVPIRINSPPELTWFVLRSSRSSPPRPPGRGAQEA